MLQLKPLPIPKNLETPKVLKKAILANKALASLNGVARIIPNSTILINSLALQEAKDSSAIENIITTHDELYRANLDLEQTTTATKEVQYYKEALLRGVALTKDANLLLARHIVEIQSVLEKNNAGVRKQSGMNLKNTQTGEVIYTPPQEYETIQVLLANLERYINEPNDIDPLINMAIIHHQFESIHPFYDGNGRTGRIINILYLILKGLLDIPILYLSNYIIAHKSEYYQLLQEVRVGDNWEEWILYILEAVEQTAMETIGLINNIDKLITQMQNTVLEKLPKIYSKDLIEVLFMHPYTKIDFLVEKLGVTRQTASKYLSELENIGALERIQIKNSKFFVNVELFALLKKGI